LTSFVINNGVYNGIVTNALESVKAGKPLSEALSGNKEIPGIMIQMMKVGEETGELGSILKTLANFYAREVKNAVDALVDLIEPLMIVLLGAGVAILLASVLIPIYNIAAAQ
ncbi:MAG: type II secretion system F family protein, partial [bacterium]|nr:type II secretion system F family protein [bacterium]